jgi:hypothetical protein
VVAALVFVQETVEEGVPMFARVLLNHTPAVEFVLMPTVYT